MYSQKFRNPFYDLESTILKDFTSSIEECIIIDRMIIYLDQVFFNHITLKARSIFIRL